MLSLTFGLDGAPGTGASSGNRDRSGAAELAVVVLDERLRHGVGELGGLLRAGILDGDAQELRIANGRYADLGVQCVRRCVETELIDYRLQHNAALHKLGVGIRQSLRREDVVVLDDAGLRGLVNQDGGRRAVDGCHLLRDEERRDTGYEREEKKDPPAAASDFEISTQFHLANPTCIQFVRNRLRH